MNMYVYIYIYIEREREIRPTNTLTTNKCLGHHRKGTPGIGNVYSCA